MRVIEVPSSHMGLKKISFKFGSNMRRRLSNGNWEIEIFKTPEEEKSKKE